MKFDLLRSGLVLAFAFFACETNNDDDKKPSTPPVTNHAPSVTVTTIAGTDTKHGFKDGQGIQSQFHYPCQMTFDKDDNLYVIDQLAGYYGGSVIRKIDPTGQVTTFASGFSSITDICVDPRDGATLYATELGNRTDVPFGILKIAPDGSVTEVGGQGFIAGYQDGPLETAKFSNPNGIEMDKSGNLYVADVFNYCVRKINLETKMVSTYSGKVHPETQVCSYADGKSTEAQFCTFEDLSFDNKGNLFIPDYNNMKIRKVATDGSVSTYIKSVDGDDLEGPFAKAYVAFPTLCSYDRNNDQLFIVDKVGTSIKMVTKNEQFYNLSKHVVKSDYVTSDTGNERSVHGIAVNKKGEVFISDKYNHCIRKYIIEW